MDFYFTLNLKRLAKLSVATSFWDNEKVQTKVKEYFYKHERLRAEDEWIKITKSATDLLERTCFPLPSEMYAELVCIIRDIGLKIHDWFDSIKYMVLSDGVNRKTLYDLYMKKIYWTHYGMIDGLRILKETWTNIRDHASGVVFTMGCLCCEEDDIYKFWMKLPRSLRMKMCKSKSRKSFYYNYRSCILLYWLETQLGGYFPLKKFNKRLRQVEGDCREHMDPGQSPEENMLIYSAYKGYGRAVKYFCENTSPLEQDVSKVIALTCALKGLKSVSTSELRHFFRKEQCIETCIFLMKQMNESDMQEAIKLEGTESEIDIENIIHLFMNIWPWWEKFSDFLSLFQPFLTEKNYDTMFNVVVDYYSEDLKNRVYQRMIRSIWQTKPNDAKITLEEKHFDCLLDAWDLTSLKMIFKDPSVSEAKGKLMKFVFQKMISFLNNNEEEKIEEFIKEVLSVEEENEVYVWILKCDVKNLTNLHSDEKLKKIKSELDAKLICKYYITKNEFDVADKFLKWRFDSSKSQIRNLKFEFRNTDFTQEYIFDVWIKSKDVKEAKIKCNKFLNWFLIPIEIGPFKQKHVIEDHKTSDESDCNRFFDQFVEKDRFEMVEPLMVWCGIAERYVADYRRFLIKACVLHYLENNKIDMAEKLFVWAIMGEKSRNKYVQDLISSDREFFRSLKRFIANRDEEHENLVEVFTGFINFWIKPTGFFKKIRRELISWKERIKILNGREINRKKIRKDPWLSGVHTDDDHLDRTEDEKLDWLETYCSDKKIDLFISVLDSLKNDDTSVKPLNVCRFFKGEIAQNGEDKSCNKDEESSAYEDEEYSSSEEEDFSGSEEEDEEVEEDTEEENEEIDDYSYNWDADGAETDEG